MNQIIRELVNNAALLLSLALLNQLSHSYLQKRGKFSSFTDGLIIGLICVAIMMNPFTFEEGLVFDTRSIYLSLSALFFNPFSVIIAAIIATLYRISMGGVGMIMGIAVITSVTGIGLIWRYTFFRNKRINRHLNIYIFGMLIHIIMLLCMLLLPSALALRTLKYLSAPILVLYPLATLFLGMLLYQQFDQAKADAVRREDERIYKSMFEKNHAIMFIIDPETGIIVDCNTSATNFYGYGRSTLIGMHIDHINILTAEEIKAEMAKAIRAEQQYFEFRHRKADGSIANVEVYSGPIEREGKDLLYTIVHDITSKVIAQSSLIQRDRLLVTVLNYSPYAIFVQMDMKFLYLNQTACELFGADKPEDLIGTSFLDRFSPECHESVIKRLSYVMDSRSNVDPTDQVVLRMDGTPIDVNVVSVSYEWDDQNGTMTFAKDITKDKIALKKQTEMESRIREQQKLESIGILAGGVAHEINNPLNGIMNYAELIKDEVKEKSAILYADEIINETVRISEIVRNLLQFSRMEKQTHSYAKVYDIVRRTISLTNTIFLKDNITIDQYLDDDLPDIKCRSQQIQQVLMNLLTNARDALNDRFPKFTENKKIEVRCTHYFKENRRWIALSVKDYGTGVTDEVKSKIFEPFFSTKPKDRGTGLGLSISYGIVKDHHGTIEIDSVVNEYSTFIVHLPVDNGWDQEGENYG